MMHGPIISPKRFRAEIIEANIRIGVPQTRDEAQELDDGLAIINNWRLFASLSVECLTGRGAWTMSVAAKEANTGAKEAAQEVALANSRIERFGTLSDP